MILEDWVLQVPQMDIDLHAMWIGVSVTETETETETEIVSEIEDSVKMNDVVILIEEIVAETGTYNDTLIVC
jgi:hypoxanthine-guanine phosphoribosyltransferase